MRIIKKNETFVNKKNSGSFTHSKYKVRKNGRNVDMYCHQGRWIADKNYVLYENVLFPITISKGINLTIG